MTHDLPPVIVRIYGGLGNQLFMYACGLALAERRGARLLIDVGHLSSELYRPFGLGVFRLRAEHADASLVRRIRGFGEGKLAREWYHVRRSLGLARTTTYVRETGWRFSPEVLAHPAPCYLKGHWMCERYFADQADAVRQDLAFREPPRGRNAELATLIASLDEAVSIHVRRGDYLVGGNQQIYARLGADYYRGAIATIRSKLTNPRFFCFSDDPQAARRDLDLPTDTVFVDHNGNAGHEDLRLMSLCRHHIIANSTFSWWGAWLGGNPGQVVVAPQTWWIHPDYDDRDIIPERWLRVANPG